MTNILNAIHVGYHVALNAYRHRHQLNSGSLSRSELVDLLIPSRG